MFAELVIKGQIAGLKKNEMYGDRIQFILKGDEAIQQVDVKLSENDKTIYSVGSNAIVRVRAFAGKSGVGFEAIEPAQIQPTKSS